MLSYWNSVSLFYFWFQVSYCLCFLRQTFWFLISDIEKISLFPCLARWCSQCIFIKYSVWIEKWYEPTVCWNLLENKSSTWLLLVWKYAVLLKVLESRHQNLSGGFAKSLHLRFRGLELKRLLKHTHLLFSIMNLDIFIYENILWFKADKTLPAQSAVFWRNLKQRGCLQLIESAGLLKTLVLTALGPVLPTTKDVCTPEPICGGVGPR